MVLPKSLRDLGISRIFDTFTGTLHKAAEIAPKLLSLERVNAALDKWPVAPEHTDLRDRWNSAMHALHKHELMLPATKMLVDESKRFFTPEYLGSLGVASAEIDSLEQTRERHAASVIKAMQEDIGVTDKLAKQLHRNLQTFKGDVEDYQALLVTYTNTAEKIVTETKARTFSQTIGTWFQETTSWVQSKYLNYVTTHLTPPPPLLSTLPPPMAGQPSISQDTPMASPPPAPPPPPIKDPTLTLTTPPPAKKKPDIATQDGHSELMAAIRKRRPVEIVEPVQAPAVIKAIEPQPAAPLPQNNGMPPPPPPPPYTSRPASPATTPQAKTQAVTMPVQVGDMMTEMRQRQAAMEEKRQSKAGASDNIERKASARNDSPLLAALLDKVIAVTEPETDKIASAADTAGTLNSDWDDDPAPPAYKPPPPSPPAYSPPRSPKPQLANKVVEAASPPSSPKRVDIKSQLDQRRKQMGEDEDNDMPPKDDDWNTPSKQPAHAKKWSTTVSEKANADIPPFPAGDGGVKPILPPGRDQT